MKKHPTLAKKPPTKLLYWVCALILGGLLFPTNIALAQEDSGITITEVSAGIDGYCKDNAWLPVRVIIENNGENMDGTLNVVFKSNSGFSGSDSVYSQVISLPAVSRKEVVIYGFSTPNNKATLTFIDSDGKEQISQTLQLDCQDVVIGVLAETASYFNILSDSNLISGREAVAKMTTRDITDSPQGLDMLSVLVISNADTGTLTPAQIASLQQWVADGGKLLVTGGPGWQKTAAGLGELLPLIPSGSITLDNLIALENYTNNNTVITLLNSPAVVATGTLSNGAQIVVAQDGVPLLISETLGYGEIYYLAADPTLEPMFGWNSLLGFYDTFLGQPSSQPGWSYGIQNWSQIDNAVGNIPGLGLPSSLLICLFLLAYIVILGPINYFVLKKRNALEKAWISIPILVAVFTLTSFTIGIFVRGGRAITHTVALVEVWSDADNATVTGAIGLFSPTRASYDLEVGNNVRVHSIPEGSLTPDDLLTIQQTETGSSIENLKVDVGGIEAVGIRGYIPAPRVESDLVVTFQGSQININGSIQNNSGIRFEDAFILGPGISESIGTLTGNESYQINKTFYPSSAPSGANNFGVPNDTLNALFGQGVWSLDADTQRQYRFIESLMDTRVRRDAGYYLLGWSDEAAFDIDINNTFTSYKNTTLYIFALNPRTETVAGSLTFPTGMFTWSVPEESASQPIVSPGHMTFERGTFSLEFKLIENVSYQSVQALNLLLTGDSGLQNSPPTFSAQIWNFDLNDWQEIPALAWGANQLASPDRFIGPDKNIILKFINASIPIYIDAIDIELTVEQ